MSLLGGLVGIGGEYSPAPTESNTVDMGFTAQLATYLNEPDAMSKDAREAFEDAAKIVYDAAKDAAKDVKDDAKDAKDATEKNTAERVAAEAVYDAAKDDYDDLKGLGLDDWLQEVYTEMTAAQSTQSGGGAAASGSTGSTGSVEGTGSSSGSGEGVSPGRSPRTGNGTLLDESGIRAGFSRAYPIIDPDAERAHAIAIQTQLRMANMIDEIGSNVQRDATEYADVPRTLRGPAVVLGAAMNQVA